VLGVGYEAGDADVRAAFGELTKRYHPDRFARYESKELRAVAAEIFILIRDAYRKLGDDASRTQALAQLGKSSAPRAVPSKPPAIPSIVRPGQAARPGGMSATPPPPPPAGSSVSPPRARTEPPARPTPIPPPSGRAIPPPPPSATTTGAVPVLVERAGSQPIAVIPAAAAKQAPREPRDERGDDHNATTTVPGRTEQPAMSQMPAGPAPKPVTPPRGVATAIDDQATHNPAQQRPPAAATTPMASSAAARPASPAPTTPPPPRAEQTAQTVPRSQQPPPPPPMIDTGRPVLAQPPPVIAVAESGDTSALDDMLDAGRTDDALAAYKLLAKKHPNDRGFRAGIELCEGLRALAARDRLEAAQRFESALEIDPSSERAARELAEMRRQATNERKGLLSRLMGKKEG